MSQETSPDRLEQYTRILIFEGPSKARLYVSPILPEEKRLFETIDMLWKNMEAVEPQTEFRDTLHEQLLQEARREQARDHLGIQDERHHSRTPWIASAAALGAAATLAGAFAYWRWSTSRQAA